MTPKYLRMFQWKIAEKTENVINRGRCWKYSTEVGGCHETKEFARAYFSGWYVKNTHCSGWKIKTSKHAGQAVLVYWEIFFFLFLFYDMVCIGASQVALVVKNLPATTVQKHRFFGAQLSSQSNSHKQVPNGEIHY